MVKRCRRCGQSRVAHTSPSYATTGYMIFDGEGDRLAYCRGYVEGAPWWMRALNWMMRPR